MTNKHMKIWPKLLVIRKMQIKITIRKLTKLQARNSQIPIIRVGFNITLK